MAILPPDPIYILRGDMGPVHSLLFKISPYYEHIYAGGENGIIYIWDLKSHRETGKLENHDDDKDKQQCLSMLSFDDEKLIIQKKNGSIDIWISHGSTWIFNKTIETDYYGFCRCEKLSNDLMLIPLAKSNVGIFSLKTFEIIRKLESSKIPKELGEVMAIKNCGIDNKNIVLVGYESGTIASWDIDNGSVNNLLENESCPMTINFDNYWMRGIIGSPTDKIDVFHLTKNYELVYKTPITMKNSGTSVLATRVDSKVFAAGCWDGRIRIYSWKSLRPLVVLDQHRSTIFDITYSVDKIQAYNNKNLMAATGKDGTISLWDIYNQ
ncbi:hypothetical protein HCN44_011374 [Aphidius gifuensis]|uniref:Guanine nucleotide-binding protein subunit beta-like protein 1 n=1 Tax=Aphidius gifuensis TaxID=684658 RepID=A0A834XXS1_APHGI|nr:guanine nucleotide-binding protein subunit beta-like protein 1 [Aphidius gifuensis]XP_044006671.1 guanine nucleotide-binding protein subunit beta-like protein 1 [Aphidius gifuensis]KAF7994105.1 hypothetical protein HCN44_011374 [Aphidius gifuensis]